MPESIPVWFPWLLSALTGGLSAALFNSFMNWRKSQNDKKQEKANQINALKQELIHALWLIKYNYDRIISKGLPVIHHNIVDKSSTLTTETTIKTSWTGSKRGT